LEPLEGQELDQQAPWQREEANCDAKEVLLNVESCALGDSASILNHAELHNNCNDADKDESKVVEESGKDVVFLNEDLSCVDLVEELEHHKDLEDECEVQELLRLLKRLKVLREDNIGVDLCAGADVILSKERIALLHFIASHGVKKGLVKVVSSETKALPAGNCLGVFVESLSIEGVVLGALVVGVELHALGGVVIAESSLADEENHS